MIKYVGGEGLGTVAESIHNIFLICGLGRRAVPPSIYLIKLRLYLFSCIY